MNGTLYVAANDGSSGEELWVLEPEQQIGGSVTQIAGTFAGCIEQGNPPAVPAPPSPPNTWDCTAAGFSATPGSTTITLVRGLAICGGAGMACANITAAIDGIDGVLATCGNSTTGQSVAVGPLGGATSVDCSANGLLADQGNSVSIQFRGTAQ